MIIAMGLPGAGKTTVLKGLKTDYELHNFGDLMFEIEKEKFGIKDRDEMRKIPIDKQKEVQKLVYEKLATMGDKVILDTHCSVSTPKGFFPGVPFEYLKLIKVDALVLVTADVEEVESRCPRTPAQLRGPGLRHRFALGDSRSRVAGPGETAQVHTPPGSNTLRGHFLDVLRERVDRVPRSIW